MFSAYNLSVLSAASQELAKQFLSATESVSDDVFQVAFDALEYALLGEDTTEAQWTEYRSVMEVLGL